MADPTENTLRELLLARELCTQSQFDAAYEEWNEREANGSGAPLLEVLVSVGALTREQVREIRGEGVAAPVPAAPPAPGAPRKFVGRYHHRQSGLGDAPPAPSGASESAGTSEAVPEAGEPAAAPAAAARGPSGEKTMDFDAEELLASMRGRAGAPAAATVPAPPPTAARAAAPVAEVPAPPPSIPQDPEDDGGAGLFPDPTVTQAPHAPRGGPADPGAPADGPAEPGPDFATDLPGRVLGGCRIEKELGRGAMGVVFEGMHLALERRVAVKVLLPSAKRSQKDVDQFFEEARALARIENQNIVQVFDVGEHEGLHFLVMQYLEGESLAQRVERDGRVPWQDACRIACDMAKGLAVAHDKRIIHRDIKPENVFVTNEGVVKIMDFGLAARAADGGDLACGAEIMGTPAYMAPEQIDGRPMDGRADLYSLGCTLYVLITGRKPFEGESAIEVLLKQTKDVATPVGRIVEGVPDPVSQVIEKLMAKNPVARYAKAGDLVADLEKILGGGRPQVVVEIEDVMGRMQELLRQEPTRGSWASKPLTLISAAAALVASTAVCVALVLPTVDSTALAAALAQPQDEADVEVLRVAKQALAEVEKFASENGTRPDLFQRRYEELARRHGNVLQEAIAASRELANERYEALRTKTLEEARRVAAGQVAEDPVAAARALLAVPEELRGGQGLPGWQEDLERSLAAIRARTGMTYVGGGPAILGTDGAERNLGAFLVDLAEVSNADYAKFVTATGARAPGHWGGAAPSGELRDLPVVGVTAKEAEAYAAWAGKRLPTGVEWERAARGNRGQTFPWGVDYDSTRCVARNSPVQGPVPVMSLPGGRSPVGALHMGGNAAEWTADSSVDPLVGIGREVRGGSAKSHSSACAAWARYWLPEDTDDPEILIGFRCVRDLK